MSQNCSFKVKMLKSIGHFKTNVIYAKCKEKGGGDKTRE